MASKRRFVAAGVLVACAFVVFTSIVLQRHSVSRALTPRRAITSGRATRWAALRLRLALVLDSRNAEAWRALAEVCLFRDKLAAAVQAGKQATTLSPGNSRNWVVLGDCLFFSGRHAEAIHAFRRAMSLGAETRSLRRRFAASLCEIGKHDEALAEYKRLYLDAARSTSALLSILRVYEDQGRYDEGLAAVDMHQQAVGKTDAFSLCWRAKFLLYLGRLEEASEMCTRAIDAASSYIDRCNALLLLVEVCLKQGDLAAAQAAYEQAKAIAPESYQVFRARRLLELYKREHRN